MHPAERPARIPSGWHGPNARASQGGPLRSQWNGRAAPGARVMDD